MCVFFFFFMLYMIGIGLGDERDITVKGLDAIKKSDRVFYENYTSISRALNGLQDLSGKKFELASRDLVESHAEKIISEAKQGVVSFLVVGDVFGATTHTDLYLRAKKEGVEIKIINNASIINAVGNTGLELYRFGQTTSIVFDDDNWLPDAPYNVIFNNKKNGLHTLCLLDIKMAEPSVENLKKGIMVPEPPRFMTVNKAIEVLEKLEKKNNKSLISDDTFIVGVARIGSDSELILSGKLKDVKNKDFGKPLHSLIIPGKLHDLEREMLDLWR